MSSGAASNINWTGTHTVNMNLLHTKMHNASGYSGAWKGSLNYARRGTTHLPNSRLAASHAAYFNALAVDEWVVVTGLSGCISRRLLLFPHGNINHGIPGSGTRGFIGCIAGYLDFVGAPFTPMQSCPKAQFELMVINQMHPDKSSHRVTEHMFTIQTPDWGFSDLLQFKETLNPENGFVVKDVLELAVGIALLPRETGRQLLERQGIPGGSSWGQKQRLVYLDVGGTSFKVAISTLSRYPESLLYKMLQEFPDLVEKGEELYIDRNPKAFPWILEIYRDGDYRKNIPSLPEDCLQRELDFYQLPSASELKIELLPLLKLTHPIQSPMVELFYEIFAEIKTCGFADHASLSAFVYYKHTGERVDGGRRALILPPVGYKLIQYITDRGHDAFDRAVFQGSRCTILNYNGGRVITPPNSTESFRIVTFKDRERLSALNQEAMKFGMQFESVSFEFGPPGKKLTFDLLKMQYKTQFL